MDKEKEIAEQLASRMPHNQPQPETEVSEDTEDLDTSHNNLPLDNMVLRWELADYFNIQPVYRSNPETRQQLDAVISWATEEGQTTELSKILFNIRTQLNRMGDRIGTPSLHRLYGYVKLSNQSKAIEEKMRAL